MDIGEIQRVVIFEPIESDVPATPPVTEEIPQEVSVAV